MLADLGRFADAEAVLRRAVAVRDTTAEFNLGTVLDQQGRWDEARAHYERALAIDPFNTQRDEQPGRGARPARRHRRPRSACSNGRSPSPPTPPTTT